jgi:hypothetical protein
MIKAAALALANLAPTRQKKDGNLLGSVTEFCDPAH